MLIGYARISTDDQKLDLQRDALMAAGVAAENIFSDEISGAKARRVGLDLALKRTRKDDTFIVWRLDRLGRSLRELIDVVDKIQASGANFHSLTEHMETSTAVGKLMFHVFGAVAEFERNLLIERTYAGMAAAKARGRVGGRQHYVQGDRLVELKRAVLEGHAITEIAARFNIKPRTVFNYVPGGKPGLEGRIAAGSEPKP